MSWIIVEKSTNKAVLETWQEKILPRINQEKYQAFTAYEYLVQLNRRILEGE